MARLQHYRSSNRYSRDPTDSGSSDSGSSVVSEFTVSSHRPGRRHRNRRRLHRRTNHQSAHPPATFAPHIAAETPGSPTCNYPNYSTIGCGLFTIKPRPVRICFWILIVLLALIQVALVAILIAYIITTNGETDNMDSSSFALWKNTRVQECLSLDISLSVLNCNILTWPFFSQDFNAANPGQPYPPGRTYLKVGSIEDTRGTSRADGEVTTLRWCDIVSCLSHFKAIPSRPRPSAVLPNGFEEWFVLNMTTFIAVLKARRWIVPRGAVYHKCKVGFLDWVANIYTLTACVFWWVSFILWVVDPAQNAGVYMVNWVLIWLLAHSMNYHPVSCVLEGTARKNVLTWLLWFMAASQWLATTVYFVRSGYCENRDLKPRYDCLESEIANSPGTSACSAQQICSTDWLFGDPIFTSSSPGDPLREDVRVVTIVYYVICTSGLLIPPLFALLAQILRAFSLDKVGSPDSTLKKDIAPILGAFIPTIVMAILGPFIAVVGILLVVHAPLAWDAPNHEAAVAFDLSCTTFHVTLSPWRSYLDVPQNRVLRIAQRFFVT